MSENDRIVFGGVDTHRDTHVAAVVDAAGRVLGSAPFRADVPGYERLNNWLGSLGRVVRVGIEGTGSYGAGLARYLTGAGVEVVEVNRPNRQLRRRFGKTDVTDAQAAARAALNGQATGLPKSGNGPVEAIRMLTVVRRSAIKARTQAINQLHALVVTAPDQVKHQLRGLSPKARVNVCAGFRPGDGDTTIAYAKHVLRPPSLGPQIPDPHRRDRRTRHPDQRSLRPGQPGAVGHHRDRPGHRRRLIGRSRGQPRTHEIGSVLRCPVRRQSVQASSGPIVRHRLNRGGDRQANNALWRIATTRMRCDQTTIEYAQRRQAEGKTRREIIRCLKRYIARQVYRLLTGPPSTPDGADLRCLRQNTRLFTLPGRIVNHGRRLILRLPTRWTL